MKKVVKIILIFVHVLPGLIAAQDGYWEIIGEMPYPVTGAEAFTARENIYILGGYYDSTQSFVPWIQKYSTFLDVWKFQANMKYTRHNFVADALDDTVLYFGGIEENILNKNSLEMWNIDSPPLVVDNKNIFNRISSTGLIHNKNYYVIGGNPYLNSGTQNLYYIAEYNITEKRVTYQDTLNFFGTEIPDQQMSALNNDDIYIFGGIFNGVSKSIYKLNTLNRSLIKLDRNLLEPRASGRAVRMGNSGDIMIIGGYNETNPALKSTEIFTPAGEIYLIRKGPELNFERTNFIAIASGEFIYVMGGYDAGGNLVSPMERYQTSITQVETNTDPQPEKFILYQNYPNPFNPATTIKFSIMNAGAHSYAPVQLKVYDVLGREIALLINDDKMPGTYEVEFDGGNLPSGIYFYRLYINHLVLSKKMILLR